MAAEPEFTDTARCALLWVLWHHQGGSSKVGQAMRFALGMGAHDHLSDAQVVDAGRWAAITAGVNPCNQGKANDDAAQQDEKAYPAFKSACEQCCRRT